MPPWPTSAEGFKGLFTRITNSVPHDRICEIKGFLFLSYYIICEIEAFLFVLYNRICEIGAFLFLSYYIICEIEALLFVSYYIICEIEALLPICVILHNLWNRSFSIRWQNSKMEAFLFVSHERICETEAFLFELYDRILCCTTQSLCFV
jgi:hypothetical protein